MDESRFFVIDRKRFEFDDRDPIFFREKAVASRNLENGYNKCMCCDTPFKNIKSVHYW